MGNSTSRTNDQMIDQFVERRRVVIRNIERAFRFVDRAAFLPVGQRTNAYSEVPIRLVTEKGGILHPGALHLSSPTVYVTIAAELDIKKGHSFLNIGSGSGYFSTMAGCLLGDTGTNHGIDIYPNLVTYAENRVEEWLETPVAHSIGWARPQFEAVNICNEQFLEGHADMYDRIYLSFMIPYRTAGRRLLSRILRMLKVGGVLVGPCEDRLCRYIRTGEDMCTRQVLEQMNFSMAIHSDPSVPKLPFVTFRTVPCLFDLARTVVRREVRKKAYHPALLLVARSCTARRWETHRSAPPSGARNETPEAFENRLQAMLAVRPEVVGREGEDLGYSPERPQALLVDDDGDPVDIDLEVDVDIDNDDLEGNEIVNQRRERALRAERIRRWILKADEVHEDPLHVNIVSGLSSDPRDFGDLSEDSECGGDEQTEEEKELTAVLMGYPNLESESEEDEIRFRGLTGESGGRMSFANTAGPPLPPSAPMSFLDELFFPEDDSFSSASTPPSEDLNNVLNAEVGNFSGYNPVRIEPAHIEGPSRSPSSESMEEEDVDDTAPFTLERLRARKLHRERLKRRRRITQQRLIAAQQARCVRNQNKRRELRPERDIAMQLAHDLFIEIICDLQVPHFLKMYIAKMETPAPMADRMSH